PEPIFRDEDIAEAQIMPQPGALQPDRARPPSAASMTTVGAGPSSALAAIPAIAPDVSTSASELAAAASRCNGVCVEGLSGRGMRADGASLPLSGGALGDGRFRAGGYDLYMPASPGEFPVGGANRPVTTPF